MQSRVLLPSLDGDPGVTASNAHLRKLAPERWHFAGEERAKRQYRAAVLEILDIFDRCGLEGRATWFLNETDTQWTRFFPDLVRAIMKRHDEVALHTHFGGLFGSPIPATVAQASEMCIRAKRRLEQFTGQLCMAHRAGCFYQSSLTYRGIRRAGFRVVSEVNPLRKVIDAEGRLLDNADTPFSVVPWRHDATNWRNFRSKRGWFLHIPVHIEGITMVSALADRLSRNAPPVVCWDIHPHEIQNDNGSLSVAKIKTLTQGIRKLHRTYSGESMTFRDYLRWHTENGGWK